MKKIFAIASLFLFFALTACNDQKTTETVLPASEVSMERTLTFRNSQLENKALYGPGILQSNAGVENDELTISFYSYNPDVKDEIEFKIRKEDLRSGVVGEYALKSLPDLEAGLAKVTYVFRTSGSSGSLFFSQGNILTGKLTISAYDAAHNLASGSFELGLADIYDPTVSSPNQPDIRKCDVVVKGSFKNLLLQELD